MDAMQLYKGAQKKLIDEHATLSRKLCSGMARSFDEYKHYVGRLQSLEYAMEQLKTAFSTGEDDD